SRRVHAEIVHLIEQLANPHLKDTIFNSNAQESQTTVPIEETAIPVPTKPLPLTPAEERVFWETIQGYTNKQISDRLFISPRTVQTHLSNILSKLDLSNRTQLVRFAYEQGYEKA
ncbi:MAG: hypothetical protein RLZZ574_2768, partial [Cyanobacteriota bacterium]